MAPSAGFPERGIPEETNRQRDVSSFTTLRFIAAQTETTHPCCRDYKTNPIQTGGVPADPACVVHRHTGPFKV